jgi:ribosome-binding factor A
MDERRTIRISEALKEELSEIITFEMQDPRLEIVEVTDVHVSPDGRHATVVVGARCTARETKEALAALDHAQGYFRHELASRLTLRHVPELRFQQDKNPDVESRIDFLIRRAKKSRRGTEK